MSNIMKNKQFIFKFVIVLFLSSCENTKDQKILGQIVGAAVGGYLGSKVGSGVTKDISVILGGAAGYILGGKIVKILNENDTEEFNNVIEDSLNYTPDNTSQVWKSKSDEKTSGEVIPLKTYNIEKNNCRDFKKIIKKNNEIFEEESTACRDRNGNWVLI